MSCFPPNFFYKSFIKYSCLFTILFMLRNAHILSALVNFIALLPDGFSFTTTITLCMLCTGHNVIYLPISYEKRIKWAKTIVAWFDRYLKSEPGYWNALYPE